MFLKNIKEQIYALAGLHQACLVVSNLAWRGDYENKDFDALINCIIDTNIINKNPMVNDTVTAPRNAVNRTLLNLYSVDTTEDNAQINHTNSKNLQT